MVHLKHEENMKHLKSQHRLIKELIGGQAVSYLDIPMHGNIGDLLILEGTLRFFEDNQIKVEKIFAEQNFYKSSCLESTVILFHGGGNLGDLYSLHQSHREDIISEYRDQRIIILPQTIHFESDRAYQKCCQIFSEHPDLHICVRDKNSLSLAEKMTKNVYLIPDMAHQMYPVSRTQNATGKSLFICRKDKEALAVDEEQIEYGLKLDWDDLLKDELTKISYFLKLVRNLKRFKLHRLTSSWTSQLWIYMARRYIQRAIDLFSEHEHIYTNRLHGHILASLMDMPNTVFDNSYGKNSSYQKLWTNR